MAVVLVGATMTATTGPAADAEAPPEKVLQSVAVRLGPDGTIQTIDSSAVRRADGEEATTSEESFDPAEAGSGLPVRVLTSYRLGDRAGTDLSEIEGESGRLVVDLTVQNTTVRPDLLEYDAQGERKQSYALVGTPLTVIASAELGADSLSRIVTTGQDENADATNGVLSKNTDGTSSVQWAAVLAPPRLAPSATFRLVADVEDFEVPSFDLSVQPGLVTDSSMESLLTAAFSDDAGSTLSLESETISLIGEVSAVLVQAGSVLGEVQQNLSGTAGQLGRQTIADLQSSTTNLSSALLSVGSDIEGLEGTISGTLSSTSSQLTRELGVTLGRVQSLLGDPRVTQPPPAATTATDCEVGLPTYDKRALTVYEHVVQVSARLQALQSASQACSAVIAQDLVRGIGTAGDASRCTSASTSAVCVIEGSRRSLDDEAQDLVTLKSELLGLYDGGSVVRLQEQVATMTASMETVRGIVTNLVPGGGSLDGPLDAIDDLDDALEVLQGDLSGFSAHDVEARFGDINWIADGQVEALDLYTDPEGLSDTAEMLGAVVTTACGVPADGAGTPQEVLDYLAQVRTSCTGAGALATSLIDQVESLVGVLQATRSAWSAVATKSDATELVTSLETSVHDFATRVQGLRDFLAGIRSALSDPDGGSGGSGGVVQQLVTLGQTINGMWGLDTPLGACPGSGPAGERQLRAIQRTVAQIACNSQDIAARVESKFGEVDASILGSQGDLVASLNEADAARVAAQQNVERLTEGLGQKMSAAALDVQQQGRAAIRSSRAALSEENSAFVANLDKGVQKVVDRIAGNVTSATRSLSASENQLRGDLQSVLLDLGDPSSGSGGLLGSLRTSASQTGLSTRQLTDANGQAASFANVRAAALDDVYLQQAQLRRSLELQQQFPVFGIELPAGSRVLTVFSFHLGGS